MKKWKIEKLKKWKKWKIEKMKKMKNFMWFDPKIVVAPNCTVLRGGGKIRNENEKNEKLKKNEKKNKND